MRQKRVLPIAIVFFMVAALIASLMGTGGCAKTKEVAESGERPLYGGTLNMALMADPSGFDDAVRTHSSVYPLKLTHEELWEGDWTKGNAGGYGTGECDWFLGANNRLEHKAGALAESWEIQGKDTVVFHLRKGVYWHNKPPTNGREVTAEDVVFSWNRQCTATTAYIRTAYPKLCATAEVSAPDPYTVVFKFNDPNQFANWFTMSEYWYVYPKDAIEEFGNMMDWKNNIGSGPFTITDYVAGNMVTFARNPNYWGKNPIGPGKGDQLPYVDEVKMFVIPDDSTRYAAFRTGQIDILTCDWEAAPEFLAMPQLKYVRYLPTGYNVIYMRTDKKDSPYASRKVRQALMLAIDHKKILNEYYGGEGALLIWPMTYMKEYADVYVPLEQLPKSVQEQFEYNPEKAKQLLAEAGYPNGFKTKVICYMTRYQTDVLSMVKDMWAKVGVELEIEPKDYGTWLSICVRRSYDDMLMGTYAGANSYIVGVNWSGSGMNNGSYIDDPVLNDTRDKIMAAFPNEAEADRIYRDMVPYLLDQAYVIQLPMHYLYRFWWPWVKNYSGEMSVGFWNEYNFVKYVWIDQQMKSSMLGK